MQFKNVNINIYEITIKYMFQALKVFNLFFLSGPYLYKHMVLITSTSQNTYTCMLLKRTT